MPQFSSVESFYQLAQNNTHYRVHLVCTVCADTHTSRDFLQRLFQTYLFTILWTSVFPSFFGCSGLTGGETLSHSWAPVLSGDRSVNSGSSSRSLWDYIRQKESFAECYGRQEILWTKRHAFCFSSLNSYKIVQNAAICTAFYHVNVQKCQPLHISSKICFVLLVQNHRIKSQTL